MERGVADPVTLECCAMAVIAASVELDDKSLVLPHRVDFEAFDEGVQLRGWQAGIADYASEETLEPGAGHRKRSAVFGDESAEWTQCAPPGRAPALLVDGSNVEQLKAVGLFEGGLELPRPHYFGEIQEDGAWNATELQPTVTNRPSLCVDAAARTTTHSMPL